MFEVYCSNIGNVYSGSSESEANKVFKEYKNQSEADYGRAAGETVTLMTGENVLKEFVGKLELTK